MVRNLIEVINNKALNEIVDQAVREALRLQLQANKERDNQRLLEEEGKPYDYKRCRIIEDGVRGLCQVLWRVFGGYPIDSIEAIRKIAVENKSDYLGLDSRDYVDLFMEALEKRRRTVINEGKKVNVF